MTQPTAEEIGQAFLDAPPEVRDAFIVRRKRYFEENPGAQPPQSLVRARTANQW